jgi:hypothetical protein
MRDIAPTVAYGMNARQKSSRRARKLPMGDRRRAALREAGRLRIAAELNRWLTNK